MVTAQTFCSLFTTDSHFFSWSQEHFLNVFSQHLSYLTSSLTEDTGCDVWEGFQLCHRMNKSCCLYHLGCGLYIKTVWNFFNLWPAQIAGWPGEQAVCVEALQPMLSYLLRSLSTSPLLQGQTKTTMERCMNSYASSVFIFICFFSILLFLNVMWLF